MVLKRTTEYLGCFIVIFSWLFIPFVSLTAAINVTVTYGGNDRIVPGYINNTYDMTIRVEFTNTVDGDQDFDTYNGGVAKLLIDWKADNGDGDGFAAMVSSFANPGSIDNGIKEFVISAGEIGNQIETPSGQEDVDGYMVDFQVWHSGSGTTDQTDIDDYGAAGDVTSLIFHQDSPGWAASYPQNSVFDDDGYFNTLSIKTKPNEVLLTHDDYKSYIQLTGDSYGEDVGGVHRFDLTGATVSEVTTDNPDYKNAAGESYPLVDGARYDVIYKLYDEAGNLYYVNGPQNEIYDTTHPTISEITTSEGADAIRKKTDDYVLFTVNFSELVKGTNSLTVTVNPPLSISTIGMRGSSATTPASRRT